MSDGLDKVAVTEHEMTLDGKPMKYRATAANMQMKDESGKLKATIFFIAYEAIPVTADEPNRRPVMFVFNGGPGAAAVWLHLGTAGPKRIHLEEDGRAPGPPYRLVDNPHTWLAAADLVFIDPVGTGYSRPAEGEKPEQFYGVTEDVRSVADFIRLYLTKYQRWLSPVFLAGESYGTTRAAGLSEHLLDRYGIALSGIAFISTVLDFQTIRAGGSNDLPFVLYLPTYAAVAWYHGKRTVDLDAVLAEVEQWAATEYAVSLGQGDGLPPEARKSVVERLERYTGLPADLIDQSNLRIDPSLFQKRLLSDRREVVGRFDGRITGVDPEPAATWPPYDPSLSSYLPIYSATFNDHVRRVLKYESALPYEVLSGKVHPWKYGEPGTGYLSTADNLRAAMMKNPHLKVLFASGYFDLATPYFAADYTINRLDLGPKLRGNARHTYYRGGHMMYHDLASQKKLRDDLVEFIHWAAPQLPEPRR